MITEFIVEIHFGDDGWVLHTDGYKSLQEAEYKAQQLAEKYGNQYRARTITREFMEERDT